MSDVQKLENSKICVEIQKKNHCAVNMDVVVFPDGVRTAYETAFKKVKKNVSLPGFRKGKAPDNVIKSSFAQQIEGAWAENVERYALVEACSLAQLYPCRGTPPVKANVSKLNLEENAQVSLAFEAAPVIPEVNIVDIDLQPVAPKKVTEEVVEEKVNEFLNLYGNWSEVEGRGLAEGDYVDLNISNAKDASVVYCADQRFQFVKDKLPSWIYNPLQDHVVGDKVEAVSERSEEIPADAEFTPTLCVIEVKAIKSLQPAELNVEFAQKMGLENVEAFRARITEMAENMAKQAAHEEFAHKVKDYLLQQYAFDVPKTLVEAQQTAMLNAEWERLKLQEMPAEEVEARLRHFIASQDAERALKCELLFSKIAKASGIQVTNEELARAINPAAFEAAQNKQDLYEAAYKDLIQQKVTLAIEEACASKIA